MPMWKKTSRKKIQRKNSQNNQGSLFGLKVRLSAAVTVEAKSPRESRRARVTAPRWQNGSLLSQQRKVVNINPPSPQNAITSNTPTPGPYKIKYKERTHRRVKCPPLGLLINSKARDGGRCELHFFSSFSFSSSSRLRERFYFFLLPSSWLLYRRLMLSAKEPSSGSGGRGNYRSKSQAPPTKS